MNERNSALSVTCRMPLIMLESLGKAGTGILGFWGYDPGGRPRVLHDCRFTWLTYGRPLALCNSHSSSGLYLHSLYQRTQSSSSRSSPFHISLSRASESNIKNCAVPGNHTKAHLQPITNTVSQHVHRHVCTKCATAQKLGTILKACENAPCTEFKENTENHEIICQCCNTNTAVTPEIYRLWFLSIKLEILQATLQKWTYPWKSW